MSRYKDLKPSMNRFMKLICYKCTKQCRKGTHRDQIHLLLPCNHVVFVVYGIERALVSGGISLTRV
jgi:hypothetical protein